MKKILLTLILIGLATSALAQTSTTALAFDYGGATLTEVNGWTKTILVNGTALTATPTCVQAGADVTCSVAAPTLTVGQSNTIEIRTASGGMEAIYQFTGIDPARAPKGLKGAVRIQTRIVINVGS